MRHPPDGRLSAGGGGGAIARADVAGTGRAWCAAAQQRAAGAGARRRRTGAIRASGGSTRGVHRRRPDRSGADPGRPGRACGRKPRARSRTPRVRPPPLRPAKTTRRSPHPPPRNRRSRSRSPQPQIPADHRYARRGAGVRGRRRHPFAAGAGRPAGDHPRRRRRTGAADLSGRSGGILPAGRRGTARMAAQSARRQGGRRTAPHAAHIQGQRAHGRRDAPGRTDAPHGVALVAGRRAGAATPELFEALETSLDHIAFVLDRLRSGETNTPLPWVVAAEEPAECRGRRAAGTCASTAGGRTAGRCAAHATPFRQCPRPRCPRLPKRHPNSKSARARNCAFAPTSSTVSSTKPAKSPSPVRASKANCVR